MSRVIQLPAVVNPHSATPEETPAAPSVGFLSVPFCTDSFCDTSAIDIFYEVRQSGWTFNKDGKLTVPMPDHAKESLDGIQGTLELSADRELVSRSSLNIIIDTLIYLSLKPVQGYSDLIEYQALRSQFKVIKQDPHCDSRLAKEIEKSFSDVSADLGASIYKNGKTVYVSTDLHSSMGRLHKKSGMGLGEMAMLLVVRSLSLLPDGIIHPKHRSWCETVWEEFTVAVDLKLKIAQGMLALLEKDTRERKLRFEKLSSTT